MCFWWHMTIAPFYFADCVRWQFTPGAHDDSLFTEIALGGSSDLVFFLHSSLLASTFSFDIKAISMFSHLFSVSMRIPSLFPKRLMSLIPWCCLCCGGFWTAYQWWNLSDLRGLPASLLSLGIPLHKTTLSRSTFTLKNGYDVDNNTEVFK